MKWILTDVDAYNQSKEYVDTAIIPLIPIAANPEFKVIVQKGEFLSLLVNELERQLKGRVFLFPPYSYVKNSENVFENLIEWKNEIKKEFKHIFFITNDEYIKSNKTDELSDELIWTPTVPMENMDDSLKRKLLADQVEQIIKKLLQSWNN
ncbi:YpiF family protein [Metabacillus malikii]|uniref:DUF2487 family protein n=1 Tax=Metabacillus malikii TaxID=1504265 RepID=A0ABT9ZAY4_9BACI|nr:YpiF family protein [Metabacillus malikii]MDQ0228768.1 hypothetical protein [Metabacillus malikii]